MNGFIVILLLLVVCLVIVMISLLGMILLKGFWYLKFWLLVGCIKFFILLCIVGYIFFIFVRYFFLSVVFIEFFREICFIIRWVLRLFCVIFNVVVLLCLMVYMEGGFKYMFICIWILGFSNCFSWNIFREGVKWSVILILFKKIFFVVIIVLWLFDKVV